MLEHSIYSWPNSSQTAY